MLSDSDLPAILEHRADRALRKPACAYVLAERHQQSVDLHPVFPRQSLLEGQTGVLRSRGADVAPPVGHPVDMHIDAYLRRPTGDAERKVGAFRTDATERRHHFEITGEHTVIFRHDPSRDLADVAGLGSVERRGAYDGGDLVNGESGHR